MTTRIEHQIIKKDGRPAFAVIPYSVFKKLERDFKSAENDDIEEKIKTAIPLKVVEINVVEGKSLLRAWREYLGLSQAEVAEKASMTQAALSQLEKPDAKPRKATLKKLAAALDLQVEQLQE